jgi:transketolase
MPCWELFEQQREENRQQVLPSHIAVRAAVEQAPTCGWKRYVGASGHINAIHMFGASAPLKALPQKFGFQPENVVPIAQGSLKSV